jgi:hypothetical protein
MHINYNTKFVRFSYEPMKIGFCKKLYQFMKFNKFMMLMEEKTKKWSNMFTIHKIYKRDWDSKNKFELTVMIVEIIFGLLINLQSLHKYL